MVISTIQSISLANVVHARYYYPSAFRVQYPKGDKAKAGNMTKPTLSVRPSRNVCLLSQRGTYTLTVVRGSEIFTIKCCMVMNPKQIIEIQKTKSHGG